MNILKSIGITILVAAIWFSSLVMGYIFAILGTILFIGFISYELIVSSKNDHDAKIIEDYFNNKQDRIV